MREPQPRSLGWFFGRNQAADKRCVCGQPLPTLERYTFTFKSVARFMVALKDSDRFRNIDLTSTQKEKIGERDVVKFQVTGELVPMSAGGSSSLPGLAVTAPGGASGTPSAPPGGTQPTRLVVQKTGEVQ